MSGTDVCLAFCGGRKLLITPTGAVVGLPVVSDLVLHPLVSSGELTFWGRAVRIEANVWSKIPVNVSPDRVSK